MIHELLKKIGTKIENWNFRGTKIQKQIYMSHALNGKFDFHSHIYREWWKG
jgi:uncharacterized protein YwgA